MSSSGSEFEPPQSPSSPEVKRQPRSRPSSVAPSTSSRKRRRERSTSVESTASQRFRPDLPYIDGYRVLYNEIVEDAAARFDPSDSMVSKQIGASIWRPPERAMFFAALDRVGRHDVPAIAKAVGTKSIAEVHQYIMLLDSAEDVVRSSTLRMSDVPAAVEISPECERQLEIARDGLMCRQERFEVTREKERYGDYWLITPSIAEDIESAQMPSRRSSFGSSPPLDLARISQADGVQEGSAKPRILQDVPESELLVPSMMLELSRTLFMNGHPNPLSANPHWSNFTTPLAPEPSIYRSALMDFHTLAVSLTKRLVQASIYEATSRIRAQDWRTRKGPTRNVGKRDVLAALDMLRMERDGKERWRTVARRCRLRVVRGRQRQLVEVDWREVEQVPNFKPEIDDYATDDGTAGSGRESVHEFRARSMRAGTPLPSRERAQSSEDSTEERQEEEISSDDESEYSDVYDSQAEEEDASPVLEQPLTAEEREEMEEQALEDIDAKASKEEELRLFGMMGVEQKPMHLDHAHTLAVREEDDGRKTAMLRDNHNPEWKTWISYRADWEENASPPPQTAFILKRKSPSPAIPHNEEPDVDSSMSSDVEEVEVRPVRKRRKVTETELPIRGARAYAALQEQVSGTGFSDLEEEGSAEDQDDAEDYDAKYPVPSIEDPSRKSSGMPSSSAPPADFMDWDWSKDLETSYM